VSDEMYVESLDPYITSRGILGGQSDTLISLTNSRSNNCFTFDDRPINDAT
jgi:hypothetical protein